MGFYILSGKFGLLSPEQPIPKYDHLLASEDVPLLVERVCGQLQEFQISKIIYFTKPPGSNPSLWPYHDCLALACSRTTVPFFWVELEYEEMSD